MINKTNITGIILAGGKSERMGTDKGLIEFNNQPFIKHIIEALAPLVSNTIIIANTSDYDVFGLQRFEDTLKNAGPVAGIYTGLKHSKTDYNLILSCDIPLIRTSVLKQLIDAIEPNTDIIQVESKGQSMPLIALYNKRCEALFLDLLNKKERRLRVAVNSFKTKTIVLEQDLELYTANINTPEQLKQIKNDSNR